MSEEKITNTNPEDDLVDITKEITSSNTPNQDDKSKESNQNDNNEKSEKKPRKNNKFLRWIKRRKTLIIVLVLIIAAIIGIRFFVSKKLKEIGQQMEQEQEFALIERQDIADAISTTGNIKAIKTSKLYSALKDTKITAVNFEVGDHVNEGDVLITFSDEKINKQIAEVKEDISISKKKEAIDNNDRNRNYVFSYGTQEYNLVVSADTVQSRLKALYEACDGYGDSKRELERLRNEGASEAEIEAQQARISSAYQVEQQAQEAYDNAVRDFNEQVRRANNEMSSADSTYNLGNLTADDNVRNLQRKLAELQDSLSDYIVTAPISGTVTEVLVEAGNGFSSGDLMVIQQDDVLIVTAEIDEYDISNVKKGQDVIIRTDATGDDELKGYVSFVSPVSTAASTQASSQAQSGSSGVTYKVEITVVGKDDRLRIGMSAKLNIIMNVHKNTLVVRYDAIETDDADNSYIEVVDNRADISEKEINNSNGIKVIGVDLSNNTSKGKDKEDDKPSINTRKVPVELGIVGDYYTEIISDEISEGMQVLVTQKFSTDEFTNGFPGGRGAF